MEQQATSLLGTLRRPSAPSEAKLTLLNTLKSDIKHYRVPEAAQATIFECLRIAISQQSSSTLAASAFSTLGHLVKRLKIQDPSGNAITQYAPRLFPALQDRLGDAREPNRTAAAQALTELWACCAQEVEQIVRDEAISGPHARAKETGMQWVVQMHNDVSLPFKSFVSPMVANLEDADGAVREAAKTALIELFRNAPSGAKADLKKQLKAHSVRKSIESQILSSIGAMTAAPTLTQDSDLSASTRSLPALDNGANFNESINSEEAQPPPVETVPMDPIYVHSQRELEDIFQEMRPHFEGKEQEHNWSSRDKDVMKLRRILKGNAPNEFHAAYMVGIKSLRDGILKVANSLRTTVSSNGCELVQELAKTLGPAMDSMAEIFLQNFVKTCAATKHIAAENGNKTVDAIFQNVSYDVRLMQHIWHACQDKNVQPRQFASGWLRTILRKQAGYRSHFENSGGLKMAEDCIAKGVVDANPKVRENMRATYWAYARTWPDKGEVLLGKLEPKWQDAVRKDQNNPNSSTASTQSSFGASVSAKTTAPAGRSALKEIMAAQKRAKLAGKMPERPSSAMATLSPVKQKSISSLNGNRAPSGMSQSARSDTRVISSGSTNGRPAESSSSGNATSKGNSLMSGPVRRPRRPEMVRPQTADPYASRRMMRPETPSNKSPANSPQKGTGASKTSIPTSSAARNRAKTSPPSQLPSPIRRGAAPPHMNESRPTSKGSNGTPAGDLSTSKEDDFTVVMPLGKGAVDQRDRTGLPGHRRPALDKTMSVDSGMPAMAEDDGFTMVMPSLHASQRERSPLAYRSAMQAMQEEPDSTIQRPSSAHRRSPERSSAPSLNSGLGISRQGSPLKAATPQPEEVQVYEDPFTSTGTATHAAEERHVLGELPVNENVRVHSPTHSAGSSASPAGSPRNISDARSPHDHANMSVQDRAEVLRSRRLLSSAIEKIRTKGLDAHGFRRVQDIVKSGHDIWDGGKKYDELLEVLLEYLQTFDQDPRLNQTTVKAAGLKSQALGLTRALLSLHRKSAIPWYPKALVTVLISRGNAESNSHVVADSERTAEDIVNLSLPEPCLEAVLDFLASSSGSARNSRSTAMALNTLRQLLGKSTPLSPMLSSRLAQAAARFLNDADADVRKADVDFASELYDRVGSVKADYWAQFKGVDEGRLGLLTYYITRRGKAVAQ